MVVKHPFNFGIYAGGVNGTLDGKGTNGPNDDPNKIQAALDELQGDSSEFLVRAYTGYKYDPIKKLLTTISTPDKPEQYAINGRKLDLVLSFQNDDDQQLIGWKELIRDSISRYGENLAKVQITEEANVDLPPVDGYYQHAIDALVHGVVLAKDEVRRQSLDIKVGFNATLDFDPEAKFWHKLSNLAQPSFYDALDYVGLDFFPDVFNPIPFDSQTSEFDQAIKGALRHFRHNLRLAGIGDDIPLHITENGWPTNSQRSVKRQGEILEKVIRSIYKCRQELNINYYELFDLRDANSSVDEIFHQFGIMYDDYKPKPAFFVFKKLIAEMVTE